MVGEEGEQVEGTGAIPDRIMLQLHPYIPVMHWKVQKGAWLSHVGGQALPQSVNTMPPVHTSSGSAGQSVGQPGCVCIRKDSHGALMLQPPRYA